MRLAKLLLILIAIFASVISYSQKFVETYYDYRWQECFPKEARFYSISRKTDSGWHRVDYFINLKKIQMAGLYDDKENTIRNGTFYWFYPDGTLKSIGKYIHNKKEGVWLNYFPDRSLKDSSTFKNGNSTGISLGWYNNGTERDSLNVDSDGNGVYLSWFDNGNPSSAGRYIEFNEQQGRWQYFHKNGKLSSLELYDHNLLKDKNYFDENGSPMADTTSYDSDVRFPGGDKAWGKYLSNNIRFPANYELQNSAQAEVVVTGTIDEDGKVIDVEVSVPLFSVFDKIALDALKNSPSWMPAVSHNRKVYHTFSQAVSFTQSYF